MRISDWSSDVCSSDLPESEKKARVSGAGVMRISSAARVSAGSCVQPAKMSWSSFSDWSRIAAMMRGWAWPWVVTHQLEMASIQLRQSAAWRSSEEQTSELQSLMRVSYAALGLTKKRQYSA